MTTRIERGRASHRLGMRAETKCVWFLRCKGYRILERRFKTLVGEIDIVAKRGRLLVFVEVKARPDSAAAALAITAKTMVRMQRAAEYYLVGHPRYAGLTLRIDLMFVTAEKLWPVHLCDSLDINGNK